MRALNQEQAQAIADVIIKSDAYSWSIYDDLAKRFPSFDWISLCEPDAADPRETIPRPAFIGPQLPNEGMRVMDRHLKKHIAALNAEMDKPTVLLDRLMS